MEIDLLLINPPITLEDAVRNFCFSRQSGTSIRALLCAATVRSAGYSVQILDAPALSLDLPQTIDSIAKINANLIGITASTVSIPRAAELARAIKNHSITAPILVGGPHVSSMPEETVLQSQGQPQTG